MAYKKVGRTIFKINDLIGKISIGLFSSEGQSAGIDIYEFNNDKNINLQYYPLLILDITSKMQWCRKRSIILNNKTIIHFIRGLKKLINLFKNDIYYYNSEKKLCLGALDDSYYIRLLNLGDNNIVEMYPVIIEDRDFVQYEGARIVFNDVENYVELSYDELISLEDIMKKIDLFTYSQLLINFALLLDKKVLGDIEYSSNNRNIQYHSGGVTSIGNVGRSKEPIFQNLKLKED